MEKSFAQFLEEILAAHEGGEAMTAIGRRLGVKPRRVKSLLGKARQRASGLYPVDPAVRRIMAQECVTLEELQSFSDEKLRRLREVGESTFWKIKYAGKPRRGPGAEVPGCLKAVVSATGYSIADMKGFSDEKLLVLPGFGIKCLRLLREF